MELSRWHLEHETNWRQLRISRCRLLYISLRATASESLSLSPRNPEWNTPSATILDISIRRLPRFRGHQLVRRISSNRPSYLRQYLRNLLPRAQVKNRMDTSYSSALFVVIPRSSYRRFDVAWNSRCFPSPHLRAVQPSPIPMSSACSFTTSLICYAMKGVFSLDDANLEPAGCVHGRGKEEVLLPHKSDL